MASSVLSFILLGNSASAERALQRVGAEAETTAARTERASARMQSSLVTAFNKVGQLATVAVIGIGVEAVRAASKFESAMTLVHTQAGASNAEVAKLGKQILDLAPKVGVGPEALATSLYHVESAGFRGAKAMEQVAAAAKLSMIGNTDIETATQAIIAVMASGIKGVRDAADATALLNTTVGIGDMRMADLAASLGSGILPVAKAVGLSFEDVAAAAATMTDNATKPQEVMTKLKTALLTLIKPSSQQAQAFSQIGMSTLQIANDFQKPNGLLVAVKDLKAHLEATYPAGQSTKLSLEQIKTASDAYYNDLVTQGTNAKDATKLTKAYTTQITAGGSATVLAANNIARALGGSKTAAVFLTLLGQSDRLTEKFGAFGDATSRAAKLAEAWAKQQETAKQKLADVKAAWDVFLVQIGNKILPMLKKVLDVLAKHPGIIKDVVIAIGLLSAAWVAWKIETLIVTLGRLAGAILGIGAASTTAAAETTAANLGGAAGGAASSRVAGLGAAKLILPIAIAYGLTKATGTYNSISDVLHGDFNKAAEDLPGWGKKLGTELSDVLSGTLSGTLDPNALDKATGLNPVQRYLNALQAAALAKEGGGPDPLGIRKALFPGTAPLASAGVQGTLDGGAYSAAVLKKFLEALAGAQGLFNQFFPGLGNSAKAAAGGAAAGLGAAGGDPSGLSKSNALNAATDKQNKQAAVSKYLMAMQAHATAVLASENDNYARSLDATTKKLALNRAGLVWNGQAGVDNRTVVQSAIVAADEHSQAVYRQTGSLGQAKAAFRDSIRTIEDNMVALGYNRDTVNQLVNQLIGAKNNSRLDIEVIANGTFNLKDIFQSAGIAGAAAGAAAAFATGGHVRGAGSGTSDSIPAYLSAGEYVMPAHVVKQLGVGFFDGLRANRYAAGGLAAFDAQFPPTMNQHTRSLEYAMNDKAQAWFRSRQTADMAKFTAQSAGGAMANPGSVGGSDAAKAYAQALLSSHGWGMDQWPALLTLWNRESGWNPYALNSIGAMGIPQALGHGPVFALGDYIAQVQWGENYIAQRWGSPAAALANSFAYSWYANGTPNAARGWGVVGERGPELVNFRGGETVYSNSQSRAMAGTTVNVNVYSPDARGVKDWLQREGAVLIQAALTRRNGRG